MDSPIYIGDLRWRDVDPRTHELDERVLDEIVRAAVREAAESSVERGRPWIDPDLLPPPSVTDERAHLAAELDRRLTARFGAWVNGFQWAASEPGGGGLVTRWCCPGDSLRLNDEEAVSASIENVKAAVLEWRSVLEELDRRYSALDAEAPSRGLAADAEHAGPDLAELVVARTDATDAWYATFATVLRWYLERRGHDGPNVGETILEVSRGMFSSWCAPTEEAIHEASARLRDALGRPEEPLPPDALARWLGVREAAFRPPPDAAEPRPPVTADGHLAYVASHDRRRDPRRADRMEAAILAARRSALAGEALTLEALAAWTSQALGAPSRVRTTDAFAKGGRERYAVRPHLLEEVRAAVNEASGAESPIVRAARVYLDVCFFHPFEDGNARAARLALDHVLTSAGLALRAAEPVFALARAASATWGAWRMAYVLSHLVGPRSPR